jgi:hypothetical protein
VQYTGTVTDFQDSRTLHDAVSDFDCTCGLEKAVNSVPSLEEIVTSDVDCWRVLWTKNASWTVMYATETRFMKWGSVLTQPDPLQTPNGLGIVVSRNMGWGL